MNDKKEYWIWLSHTVGAGSKNAVNLIRSFGNAKSVYKATPDEIYESGVVRDKRVLYRFGFKDLREVEGIMRWCEQSGVDIIVPTDEKYPKSLLSLPDAPMVLYAVGKLPDFDNKLSCAVVGTRNMSEYGKSMAYEIGSGLAMGGACVVSGLALGIDGMAMAGALESGGKTVAVLGCGIDVVYPKQHEKLLRKVIEQGAVITEYAPGVSPHGKNFPVRNRIISGLSQAVCVVEGNMRSGSLITARHAIYQGKSLYAVPGRVGEAGAEGTNFLLKQGASPITGADDILSAYEFIYPLSLNVDSIPKRMSADEAEESLQLGRKGKKKESKEKKEKKNKGNPFPEKKEKVEKAPEVSVDMDSLSAEDIKVLEYMKSDVPMLAEEIAEGGFSLSDVMVSLTMLEVAGAVEAGAGGYYLKRAADFGGEPEYITEEDNGL